MSKVTPIKAAQLIQAALTDKRRTSRDQIAMFQDKLRCLRSNSKQRPAIAGMLRREKENLAYLKGCTVSMDVFETIVDEWWELEQAISDLCEKRRTLEVKCGPDVSMSSIRCCILNGFHFEA